MRHKGLLVFLSLAVAVAVFSVSAIAQTPTVELWPSLPNANGVVSYAAQMTPVVSAQSETNHVLKAGPGNVYTVQAANMSASAGFLVLINATAAPSDGAITPLACAALAANGNATIAYAPGPPAAYNIGVVAVLITTAGGGTCLNKVTGAVTGFIAGLVM